MTLLKVFLICIFVLAIVCLISIWHASTHFHKVYYRLSSDKISKPVKFVLLSDLHDKEYGTSNCKLLEAINEENPDAVLVAGDMLTARPQKEGQYSDVSIRLISNLTREYPVYYGLGNHEAKMNWSKKSFGSQFEDYMRELVATGAVILRNQYADIYVTETVKCNAEIFHADKKKNDTEAKSHTIRIYGLDMEKSYYKRFEQNLMADDYLDRKLGQREESYYNILLAHNPAYFDKYAMWKPDLVLSGHVHGGLVRLPFFGGVISPALKLFPKYDGGKFTVGDSTMILSRGLGFHSVEFRMWNPAELVVIELMPEKKN